MNSTPQVKLSASGITHMLQYPQENLPKDVEMVNL